MSDNQHAPDRESSRSTPSQKRAVARYEGILRTAAALIHESGLASATTTNIAIASGSSVGVIYRYFPNLRAMKQALAARNTARYLDLISAELPNSAEDWLASIDVAIDIYVQMMRSEPGFRAIRFGDMAEEQMKQQQPSTKNGRALTGAFERILHAKYGFEITDEFHFAMEVGVGIADSLITTAFRLDVAGDERYIEKTRELARNELRAIDALP